MRRLEHKDEDKFWQVERRETTLRISFGKIGKSGQTKIKRCATEAEADAEIEDLVAEKVKKGFVEVDGEESKPAAKPAVAAAPAPAPKAAPAPAPAPAPAAKPAPKPAAPVARVPEIDTASRLLERAAPNPGIGRPFKAKPASESFKRLQDRFTKTVDALEKGIKAASPPIAAILRNVQKAYAADMPEKLSEETEAAAYRLFAPPQHWRDDHHGEIFARYWVAKEGGEFALRTLARAGHFSRMTDAPNTWTEPKKLWVEQKPHVDTIAWGKSDEVWIPIRDWAASLDEAGLEKARKLVEELRKELASNGVRPLLDAAIGDPDFCAQDAADIIAASAGNQTPLAIWAVLCSMTDVAKMKPIVDQLVAQWSFQHVVDQLPNMVARIGAKAGPLLVDMLAAVAKSGMGSDTTKSLAQVVALVRTPEVAEVMVENLGHKDVRPAATEFLQNAPNLALAPLAARAANKGALADLAKSVLGVVVAKAPDEARALAPSLEDHQRALIEAALDRFENVIEAEPADLPRVLASPPWLEKKRAAAPRVVSGLAQLSRPARVVWESEAQQKEFKNEQSYYAPNPAQEKSILKEIDGAIKAKKAAAVGSYKLMQLPKTSAIKTLEEAPLEVFSWYYGNVPTAFIGRYELDALRAVLRYATVDPTNAIEALSVVDAPDVAPIMADALVRLKKSRQDAQRWLMKFPETAAVALIPLAVDSGKARAKAEAALRYIAGHGKRDVVEKVAKQYGSEAADALGDVLDYDPLSDLPAKMPKLPGFFNAAALPRPRLRGQKKVLPVSAIEALGTMLAFARPDEPYAGIAQVKEACEPASLAELGWELFQAWLVAGAPNKENWAFLALAHLGDDECARKLTPLIRAWPGEAAHARAVVGLDVLAAIGTDVALMHLHGIAQKVKFKGLQERAREKIDHIAEARGLTAAELADRLVPDLGLDEDGSLELDFGARKFRVTFDEMLKPAVLDDSGKRLPDLPKPKQSDDAEKAAAATATWKALKKDSKTVATSQLMRLELAMCAQRRWDPEAFDQFFVRHPLMIHLVRRLVWGAYDGKDKLLSTFRIAEDGSYADAKDAAYELPRGAKVGLVHRLEMEQKDADSWGQVLGDYEIMQPFAQLSREAIRPADDEKNTTELARVVGITVPTGKVLGLDARGWRRGPPQDAGVVCWYEKPLGGGWVACLDLDPGIYTGMIAESPEQKLGKVVVSKNAYSWNTEGCRKLGELSPIEFSELVRDLESVRP